MLQHCFQILEMLLLYGPCDENIKHEGSFRLYTMVILVSRPMAFLVAQKAGQGLGMRLQNVNK